MIILNRFIYSSCGNCDQMWIVSLTIITMHTSKKSFMRVEATMCLCDDYNQNQLWLYFIIILMINGNWWYLVLNWRHVQIIQYHVWLSSWLINIRHFICNRNCVKICKTSVSFGHYDLNQKSSWKLYMFTTSILANRVNGGDTLS